MNNSLLNPQLGSNLVLPQDWNLNAQKNLGFGPVSLTG